jgi:hypothetical protein
MSRYPCRWAISPIPVRYDPARGRFLAGRPILLLRRAHRRSCRRAPRGRGGLGGVGGTGLALNLPLLEEQHHCARSRVPYAREEGNQA